MDFPLDGLEGLTDEELEGLLPRLLAAGGTVIVAAAAKPGSTLTSQMFRTG